MSKWLPDDYGSTHKVTIFPVLGMLKQGQIIINVKNNECCNTQGFDK